MKHYLRFLMTLVMIVFTGGVVCADEITFDATTDKGPSGTSGGTFTKDGITLTLSNGALGNGTDYRIYSGAKLTISSSIGNITNVIFTCTAQDQNKQGPGCFKANLGTYTYNSYTGTWTGDATSIIFTASTNQVRATKIVVTYTPSGTIEPTLSFGEIEGKTIEKHIGDEPFTYKATLNPSVKDAIITYTSDNGNVALVDDGYVVLGETEGKATITAKYEELTASYTINLTKLKTATTLSFGTDYDNQTITKTTDDKEFTLPATLTPSIDGAEITYSSSNKSIAEVDNTGKVTLKAKTGTAIITAEYAGNDSYAAAKVSYNILVKNAGEEVVTFDFSGTDDYGSGVEKTTNSSHYEEIESTWINGNVTMVTSGKYRWWSSTGGLRFYGGSFILTAPTGTHITNISLTGNAKNNVKENIGKYTFTTTGTTGTWVGNANSVKFTSTANGKDLKTITVTYAPDVTLTTAASSFATYAADYAVDYSAAGLEAYAIALNETEGTVAYNAINGTTPAGTAVLVKGNASTEYSLAPSTETVATVNTALQISDGNVVTADKLYYGFATINGVSGFKLVNDGITIPAKKGYLKLSSSSNAKTFYAFDGDATGIEETFTKADAEKTFAPMYNISGQRVGEGYKGIVIVNGKKYVK